MTQLKSLLNLNLSKCRKPIRLIISNVVEIHYVVREIVIEYIIQREKREKVQSGLEVLSGSLILLEVTVVMITVSMDVIVERHGMSMSCIQWIEVPFVNRQ